MLVSELTKSLEGKNERSIETKLGDIRVAPDASFVTLSGDAPHVEFGFDEQVERAFSSYLGINKSYLAKCPADLKATNLNYWLQARSNAATVIEAVGESVINIHKPGLVILPLTKVAEVVTRTFKPDNEIVNLIRDERWFHLDVKTDHHIEVHPDARIEGRKEVGDITHGGVRILANPIEAKPPKVLTYLHRLWCTNGSTSPEHEGAINIKGSNVDEVLAELELVAQKVMGDLDKKLAAYAALADRRPPGSPTRFAYQLGREYNLTQRIMDRVIERVAVLPEDASLYDVQQVFTQLANGNVNYRTMTALQHLGGDMAFATDHVVHRCETCERLAARLRRTGSRGVPMAVGMVVFAAVIVPTPPARADTICGYFNGGQVLAGPNTSCPFAMNVARAYANSGGGSVMAASPVTNEYYRMWCVRPVAV